MRLWYKQVLCFESVSRMRLLKYTSFPFSKVFQASAGGGHASLLLRHVSSFACKNTQAFPSRECFGLAFVVKHNLSYLVIVALVGTFDVHTSFLSKVFQACA